MIKRLAKILSCNLDDTARSVLSLEKPGFPQARIMAFHRNTKTIGLAVQQHLNWPPELQVSAWHQRGVVTTNSIHKIGTEDGRV